MPEALGLEIYGREYKSAATITASNVVPFELIRIRLNVDVAPEFDPPPTPPWIREHGGRYVPPVAPRVLPARPRQQRPRDGLR